MNRLLYRSLIRLHPGAFRQRFGAEMLCIFDEVALTPAEVIHLILMTALSLVVIVLATALWIVHFVRQIAGS